jgi:hypothetical protein
MVNPDFYEENLNYSADERQAKMAAMLARMREPEYQAYDDIAAAVVERLADATSNVTEWENSDDKNIPSEKIIRKTQLAQAEQEKAAATVSFKHLRGDNLDAPAQRAAGSVTAALVLASNGGAPAQTPDSLPTKDIADCFDGLNGWPAARWTKNLGESKWLHPARTALGAAGGAPSMWSPLTLAQLVHDKTKGARPKAQVLKAFDNQFNKNPVLMPWRDDFNEYFAMFSESD